MSTTKEQADRAVLEVDVLCDLAATTVRSMTPTGLGAEFERERVALEALLVEIPKRFEKVIRKGQRKGWARK